MHQRGRPADEKPIDIRGNIKFTDDTDYWQANSFRFGFQNVTTFFKLGGDDVFIYGGVYLSLFHPALVLALVYFAPVRCPGTHRGSLPPYTGFMAGFRTIRLRYCGITVERQSPRPRCSGTRRLRAASCRGQPVPWSRRAI